MIHGELVRLRTALGTAFALQATQQDKLLALLERSDAERNGSPAADAAPPRVSLSTSVENIFAEAGGLCRTSSICRSSSAGRRSSGGVSPADAAREFERRQMSGRQTSPSDAKQRNMSLVPEAE